MTIGGGLHDDDRPPPDVITEMEVHAKWREWGFWGSMFLCLWASYKGMPQVALWFTVVLVAFPALLMVLILGMREYRA